MKTYAHNCGKERDAKKRFIRTIIKIKDAATERELMRLKEDRDKIASMLESFADEIKPEDNRAYYLRAVKDSIVNPAYRVALKTKYSGVVKVVHHMYIDLISEVGLMWNPNLYTFSEIFNSIDGCIREPFRAIKEEIGFEE